MARTSGGCVRHHCAVERLWLWMGAKPDATLDELPSAFLYRPPPVSLFAIKLTLASPVHVEISTL